VNDFILKGLRHTDYKHPDMDLHAFTTAVLKALHETNYVFDEPPKPELNNNEVIFKFDLDYEDADLESLKVSI
jgi:hypothetical protein